MLKERQEYTRIVPGSRVAVLCIHGVVGTPAHFKDMVPLVPVDWSVCNMLLEGHGKGVRDFSAASMDKWKAQVAQKVEELTATHEQLYIVAHSMGCLFAIREGVKYPDRIRGLFLMAAPLRLWIRPLMVQNVCKVFFNRVRPEDTLAIASRDAYGVESDYRVWRYLGWIPRYLELFGEIRRTRRLIPALRVPCYVFQSKHDEMVSLAACRLFADNPHVTVTVLENSYHYYYEPADYAHLLTRFQELVSGE